MSPFSPIALQQPCRNTLTSGHGSLNQLQRSGSHAVSLTSRLASLSLRSALQPPVVSALAVEPASVCSEQGNLLPAAAMGNAQHTQPQQTAATQQHVVVNFYHLTDIADPERICRAHRAALAGLDVRGRIYVSSQGINAQYSGSAGDACQYARWVEAQPGFQGLRWTQAEVEGHMFPRLRLQVRSSLVSLAGGTASLPITDPAARATPLEPSQWRTMLRDAVPLHGGLSRGSAQATAGAASVAAHSSEDMRPGSAAELAGPVHSSTGRGAAVEPQQPGYSGRPPLGPDGAPSSSGIGNGQSWRSLGRSSAPAAATASATPDQPDAASSSASKSAASSTTDEAAAPAGGDSQRRGVVVLDVRNGYEWDAGHFVGAERPAEDAFRETPTEVSGAAVPAALHGLPADTPVMMYCTGGIRCDIYSAHLRKQGFTNLYTLEGGVHNYLREEGADLWNGSLFVFDGRMAVPPPGVDAEQDAALVPAVSCQLCGGPARLPHRNCANLDCNRLFIACDDCTASTRSCCCEECISAPRLLRPAQHGGNYLEYAAYAIGQETQASIATGRGEGRKLRRRRWQQRVLEKKALRREQTDQLRTQAKAQLAAKVSVAEEQRRSVTEEGDGAGERLRRLQELRAQLGRAALREPVNTS